MDPITHGIVGLAVGSLSGDMNIFANPLALGSLIGSVIPDGDIIYQYWGDYVYLKNHRGVSHSIIGITAISALVAGILKYFYPGFNYGAIILWTLLGTLSHVGLDLFNSYGAKVLWPFVTKRRGYGLLMIFDPILIISALGVYVNNVRNITWTLLSIGLFALYIVFRFCARKAVISSIKGRYSHMDIREIVILPSTIRLFNWDFIIRSSKGVTTGYVNTWTRKIKIRDTLSKSDKWIESIVMNTSFGAFFKDFSPHYHIVCDKVGDNYQVLITDLRYYVKGKYLHHATALFDNQMELIECAFHPYSLSRNVKIPI